MQARPGLCRALLSDLIKPVVEHHLGGRRAEAAAYALIPPLINYENRQCGLRATQTVMGEGGVIASNMVRHPWRHCPNRNGLGCLTCSRASTAGVALGAGPRAGFISEDLRASSLQAASNGRAAVCAEGTASTFPGT